MSTSQKMVRVRVIHQRYGGPGDAQTVRGRGGESVVMDMEDKPLFNESTGQPLINGGSFARVDPNEKDPKKRIRQWMPGEVLEMPEDEALTQIAETPQVLELESTHLARLERIANKNTPKPGAAYEIAAAMSQTGQDYEAAQRFKALHAEKQAQELAGATAALHPAHDKDRIIDQQQRQVAALQEQVDRLMEFATKPQGARP